MNRDEIIFTLICAIPAGKVSTYGAIAKQAGLPNHARLVGRLLKTLPQGSKVPWHRVINSSGKISFIPGTEKFNQQLARLMAEGIEIQNGRINLKKFAAY